MLLRYHPPCSQSTKLGMFKHFADAARSVGSRLPFSQAGLQKELQQQPPSTGAFVPAEPMQKIVGSVAAGRPALLPEECTPI